MKRVAEVLVNCADADKFRDCESPVLLGPMDHATQNFLPLTVVFVYRREKSESEKVIPSGKLRRALARLLDYYPHLTGRVVMNGEDNTPQIEKLGTGVRFVTAECSEPLEAFEAVAEDEKPGSPPRLIVTNLPGGGNALLPPFASTTILAMQHTRFACGGVSIGICIPHIICDAAGFFQLVRDLAELYRGFRDVELGDRQANDVKLLRTPHIGSHMAELHNMTLQERQEALTFQPTVVKLAPEKEAPATGTSTAIDKTIHPLVTGRILRFSSHELTALKAEANASGRGQPLSTFCALTAHIWQCVFRARVRLREAQGKTPVDAAQLVPRQILMSVDLRSWNQLEGIPPQYFPNGVVSPVLSVPVAQLLNGPLSSVAASIRESVQPQDPIEMKKTLRWIAAQSDKRRVQPRYNYDEEGVFVTQWSKFDMYRGAQFEAPPAVVAQPFTAHSLYDGLAYFMATEDQLTQSANTTGITTGSLDVSLALSEPIWAILDGDMHFRRHRSR
ncbi:hypothetical protein PRNP1_005548 [Phytophthora ramorum]